MQHYKKLLATNQPKDQRTDGQTDRHSTKTKLSNVVRKRLKRGKVKKEISLRKRKKRGKETVGLARCAHWRADPSLTMISFDDTFTVDIVLEL